MESIWSIFLAGFLVVYIRIFHRRIRAPLVPRNSLTLLFHLMSSILIFNGVLGLYGKPYNHGSGHRSYPLQDKQYLARTAPKTECIGGATACPQWDTGGASRGEIKVVAQEKLAHLYWFGWLRMLLTSLVIVFDRLLLIKKWSYGKRGNMIMTTPSSNEMWAA